MEVRVSVYLIIIIIIRPDIPIDELMGRKAIFNHIQHHLADFNSSNKVQMRGQAVV